MHHQKMAVPPYTGEPFDPGYDPNIAVHHMDMNAPQLRILEQPKQYGFRFRYECEGKSHGGIPGISSERGKKTYPATEIINYKGLARIVVSLVTNEEMPRPHAHSLVGKHCTNGICSVQVGAADMTATFPNLGILHITKKNVIPILKKRMFDYQETSKNLWGHSSDQLTDTAAEQRAKDLAKDMDLASVRLCFQAFLPDNHGHFTQPLPPVISVPIYDSKAPNATTLKICRMDRTSGSAEGGDEVYMLCDKVQKDDIQVRFFETSSEENAPCWEGFADFGPTDVHRQYAIVFKTPKYRNGEISKPIHVHLQLMRRSTKEKSEPKPFCYFPRPFDKDEINKKRQKLLPHFTHHFSGQMGQQFQGGGNRGTGGGSSGDIGGGMSNFQYSNTSRHFALDPISVAMTTANSPMQPEATLNGIHESQAFNHSSDSVFHEALSPICSTQVQRAATPMQQQRPAMQMQQQIPTTQIQHQTPIQIQHQQTSRMQASLQQMAYSLPLVLQPQLRQPRQQQPRQQQPRQQQPRQQPQMAMQFPGYIGNTASPDNTDSTALIPKGPTPTTTTERTKLIAKGLAKPQTKMDTSESGDSDLETDSGPADIKPPKVNSKMISVTSEDEKKPLQSCAVQTDFEPDKLLLLAEKTSKALYDYAITGDVKIMLAVQRHLLAVQDDYGDTSLHMSIIHQKFEVTKSMITIIANMSNKDMINIPNDLRQTPLHLAVITNSSPTVDLLMKNGADPDLVDQHGNTPLHLAVQYRNIDTVNMILTNSSNSWISADVDKLNHNGYAAIHIACRKNDLASVKALCEAHCNIDIQDGTSGYTPLHFAVENQDYGILGYLLLDTNANVNETTFNGNTPLHLAAGRNLVAVAALLLASHADPLKENYDTYIESSDSSDDEDEENPNMDLSDDEICGKTAFDMSTTDEMRALLNGDSYIDGQTTEFPESGFGLGTELSETYTSFKIDSSTTSICDAITLDRLARLLDEDGAWTDVARKVGLGNILSWLKQASSPTRDLIYHFEKIDGTLAELRDILSSMGRTDAVEMIDETSVIYKCSPPRPLTKDSRVDSIKDSGIPEELMESLRCISMSGN